jgi:pimeloyl-ACP methyl ester carboxylesterase
MDTLLFRGVEIRYESIGEGNPFLFLHGLGGNRNAVTTAYTPRPGIRLVAFDFPGHGDSGCGGDDDIFSFAAFTELLFFLQDALQLAPCALGGISMGAAVSLRAALLEPAHFTKLILVRPAWLNAPMEPSAARLYAEVVRYLHMENGLAAYRESELCAKLSAEYPALESSTRGLLTAPNGAATSEKFLRMPLDRPYESAEQLAGIDLPTLVVGTRRDFVHPFSYAQTFASQIPGAKLLEIPSKSVNAAQHRHALQGAIDAFLGD